MEPIILASSSPRRQQILKDLNIPFKVIIPEFEEVLPVDIAISDGPEYFASKKVEAVVRTFKPEQTIPWVVGADTAIIYKDTIFGKPKDRDEAEYFLSTFSGKTHIVITALAVFNGQLNYLDTRVSKNLVTFKKLTKQEIAWYLSTGEWYGAAGAYRIQGKAQYFINKLSGSYSSVIGLPISDFYDIMNSQNYSVLE